MSASMADRVERTYRTPPSEGLRRTDVPGFFLLKVARPAPAKVHLNLPGLCLTVQGSKTVVLRDDKHSYGEGEALVVGLAVPVSGLVHSPSPEKPYLGILIELKPALLRQVAIEAGVTPSPSSAPKSALNVVVISPAMASCVGRMLDLLDAPSEVPYLWPLLLRELVFRLLTGPQGADLVHFAGLGNPGSGIAEAVAEIRSRFREPISVAELASRSNMSISSFHRHFLAVTKTTPLQYQKQLRLIEARQLLEDESNGVASAAYRVGYESPSQFSRDYARFFGYAPRETLRHLAM